MVACPPAAGLVGTSATGGHVLPRMHPGTRSTRLSPALAYAPACPHPQPYRGPEDWVSWAKANNTVANGTAASTGGWTGDVVDFYKRARACTHAQLQPPPQATSHAARATRGASCVHAFATLLLVGSCRPSLKAAESLILFPTTPTRQPAVRQLYKAHLAFMLGRANSVTGRQYASDPSIYGFGVINEPR